MANQPDFIVDPSGNVQDVRHRRFSRRPEPGLSPRESKTYSQRTTDSQFGTQSSRKSGASPYVISIPIGLILAIVVCVFRFLSLPSANSNAPVPSYQAPEIRTASTRVSVKPLDSYGYSSALSSGYRAFFDGEYDRAIAYFSREIDSNPFSGEAYNGRGLVYYAKGDYDAAIADFGTATLLLSEPAVAYSNRGIVYCARGDHVQAIDDLSKAIWLKSDFGKAYYNRGLVHCATGDYDAAIADFDKAIQLTSEATQALLNAPPLGDGSDASDSLVEYMMLFQFEVDLPSSYTARGYAYAEQGKYDLAIADLERALELGLDPNEREQVEAFLEVLRLFEAD